MWLSILIGFVGSLFGLLISYLGNIPSGASIIFSLVILYLAGSAFKAIRIRLRTKKSKSDLYRLNLSPRKKS
jgi:zinc transport system permease protein